MIRKICVLLLCVASAACASTYREAENSAATAFVQFEKGYTTGAGFGTGTSQEYSIADAERYRRAAFFTWTNSTPITRRVPAGAPLQLYANTTYIFTTGVGSTGYGYYATTGNSQCNEGANFTPEAGHTYSVIQAELSYAQCELRIIDVSTGSPPRDLVLGMPIPPKSAPNKT